MLTNFLKKRKTLWQFFKTSKTISLIDTQDMAKKKEQTLITQHHNTTQV